MGHQFFERLAGECAQVFRFELECPTPDPGAVVDAGCKVVHNRTLALFVAGDLGRVVAAVAGALRRAPTEDPLSVPVVATVLDGLQNCRCQNESERIAIALLRTIGPTGVCNIDDAIRQAAQLFATQLSRMECVFRLPLDGLFGAHELASSLAAKMAARVADNLRHQRQKNPDGWRGNEWSAPRARAPKPESEKMGNELDLARKPERSRKK